MYLCLAVDDSVLWGLRTSGGGGEVLARREGGSAPLARTHARMGAGI